MRRLFLWMAGNRWLRDHLPRLWFAPRAVRRFMPGEDAESALTAGAAYERAGIVPMYTRLGENCTVPADADATLDHYLGLIDRIAEGDSKGELSVKLTALGFDLDAESTFARMERLADKAAERGTDLWIDMESSAYAEPTVAFYERLKASHPNVGLCLQAYLRRTAGDVQRLLPLEPRIRLVKGAYSEKPDVAYQGHHDVDANFLALAVEMLQAIAAGGKVRLGLGTHDLRLVEQISEHAAALGLPRTSFEVQMLYGIRAREQRRLAAEGYVVRDLISYGPAWYGWYMRRLAERPANVVFALRQVLPG
jgi:proline dehydrogenase